jgi:hypothetical protein
LRAGKLEGLGRWLGGHVLPTFFLSQYILKIDWATTTKE